MGLNPLVVLVIRTKNKAIEFINGSGGEYTGKAEQERYKC